MIIFLGNKFIYGRYVWYHSIATRSVDLVNDLAYFR